MKVTHTGAPAYKADHSQAPSNLRHVPLSSGYSSKYSSIVSDPGCRGTPGSAMSYSGATSSTVGGPGFSTYGALGASWTVGTSPPRGFFLTATRLRSLPYPPRGMKIPASPVNMITQPTTCRSRNLRWAVTAKAKIAPMATNVNPVAVFMPIPSSSTHAVRFRTAAPRCHYLVLSVTEGAMPGSPAHPSGGAARYQPRAMACHARIG